MEREGSEKEGNEGKGMKGRGQNWSRKRGGRKRREEASGMIGQREWEYCRDSGQ